VVEPNGVRRADGSASAAGPAGPVPAAGMPSGCAFPQLITINSSTVAIFKPI
jgi:hypothetical protein